MTLEAFARTVYTEALPLWLGWLAAATAVLLLISFATVFQTGPAGGVVDIADFVGFLLFLVWVLATSAVLLLRPGRQPAAVQRDLDSK